MTEYQLWQRVALTHTHDPDNPSRIGQQGTVIGYESATETVTVRWDDGTITAVRLAGADGLAIVAAAPISEDVWQKLLSTVVALGAAAGHRAADAWGREHTAHGPDVLRGTARHILRVLHDDKELGPAQAPQYDTSIFAHPPTSGQLSELLAAQGNAARPPIPQTWWQQAGRKYRDAFETAVRHRAGDWARRTIIAQAGGRDLDEMRPEQLRIGQTGVFSGDWMRISADTGPDYLRMGFVGTLTDRWHGSAVFSCSRPVAEAIIAEHQQLRDQEQASLQARGKTRQQALREVDATLTNLYFDGDVIVADQRRMYNDPQAIERTGPDADGRYVVMGRNWCWEVVNPYDCDHVVGELPAADSGPA